MVQVSKESYMAGRYARLDRFSSYFYQVDALLQTKPASILEVGVGDGVVSEYIKRATNIAYKTADFAEDLNPDVVADVRDLPFEKDSFDTACAFEVLEHLPFEDFEKAISELARVSKRNIAISLPHFSHPLKFSIKIPLLPEIKWLIQIPDRKPHTFDGQHYWEIGKRGFPPSRIRAMVQKYGTVEREFVPFESPAHHFFIFRKKAS